MLAWLRRLLLGPECPDRDQAGWEITGIYNGLSHFANGHIHRTAPAWWHLDLHPEAGIPHPNQCPKCGHRDTGDAWYCHHLAEASPDLHVRRD